VLTTDRSGTGPRGAGPRGERRGIAVDPIDEPIAGFYLIEAADRTEVEQLTAMVPDSVDAHMTVRELMPLPGIPGEMPPPLDPVYNRA
jgi:hypothetical protein